MLLISWRIWPLLGVVLCWSLFAAIFVTQKRPAAPKEAKRDNRSFLPIFLQGFAYALVWGIHRPYGSPLFGMASWPYFGALAVTIAVASVWLVLISVRTLGKQWAVAARLVVGHKLITDGPYAHIRNPIYTGMFGMLLATGLVASYWVGLLLGAVLFLVATAWRIRVEEKLLRSQFGAAFDDYRDKVSALIPYIW